MHIVNVNGLGATPTGNKEIGRGEGIQVELVAELESILNRRSIGQLDVVFVDKDTEASRTYRNELETMDSVQRSVPNLEVSKLAIMRRFEANNRSSCLSSPAGS